MLDLDALPPGIGPLNLIHKTLLRAAGGFITGGPTGAIAAVAGGGGGRRRRSRSRAAQPPATRPPGVDPALFQAHVAHGHPQLAGQSSHYTSQTLQLGTAANIVQQTKRCIPPFRPDPVTGECRIFLGDQPGPNGAPPAQMAMGGNAVMGRFGAALEPEVETRTHRDCLPGMVLAMDDLCYNRRDLRNSDRKYPKGRAPLLTGGERNAITKAGRAATKVKNTIKALKKLGLIQTPAPRKAKAAKAGDGVPANITVVATD